MVDFKLTAEQQQYQQLAREFAKQEIAPQVAHLDQAAEFPDQLYRQIWELGLMNVLIPEAHGGLGLKVLEASLIGEEMGAVCTGIDAALEANHLAAAPLIVAGEQQQQSHFLGQLTQGCSFAALALDEASAGQDLFALKTSARKVGSEYVINGQKLLVTNGGVAAWYCLIASTGAPNNKEELSVFIVPADAQGIIKGEREIGLGQKASDTRTVSFQDVKIPANLRLGSEGQGRAICQQAFRLTYPLLGAAAVGLARCALEKAIGYAKERTTFGVPIANHQAVGFMLADMAKAVESARLLCWQAAWLADQGIPSDREALVAKVYSADAAMHAATDAVQIFGGYGYSREYPVEKLMRDAKMLQIKHGTSAQQAAFVGRQTAGVF